jgi:hypothetical protein
VTYAGHLVLLGSEMKEVTMGLMCDLYGRKMYENFSPETSWKAITRWNTEEMRGIYGHST